MYGRLVGIGKYGMLPDIYVQPRIQIKIKY